VSGRVLGLRGLLSSYGSRDTLSKCSDEPLVSDALAARRGYQDEIALLARRVFLARASVSLRQAFVVGSTGFFAASLGNFWQKIIWAFPDGRVQFVSKAMLGSRGASVRIPLAGAPEI
jgi:hypothetical protein